MTDGTNQRVVIPARRLIDHLFLRPGETANNERSSGDMGSESQVWNHRLKSAHPQQKHIESVIVLQEDRHQKVRERLGSLFKRKILSVGERRDVDGMLC